ncbi:hypothetical protein M011DRAFT_41595 [Sporormia fimetaria CBS 119925]|uniref:Uncharacterized protein n=1 Tax=Sporormia fimetaria CBS 119925 TaxID=1340428 RepID=A0A6A6VE58_9PLEO|nr:hypothetical protein M011DRAFT_41595 [Sporormia fimetaria CBS 119925]
MTSSARAVDPVPTQLATLFFYIQASNSMLARDAVSVVDLPRCEMNDLAPATTPYDAKHRPELPNSQDSAISVPQTFYPPGLQSSQSNVSTATTADTELESTAPLSVPTVVCSQKYTREGARQCSPSRGGALTLSGTPQIDAVNTPRTGDPARAPVLAQSSAVVQGSKRTANGVVKEPPLSLDVDAAAPSIHRRSRSTDVRPRTRIGEVRMEGLSVIKGLYLNYVQVAAKLKLNLAYARFKVEKGCENKSLEDLEAEASEHGSPISTRSRSDGIPSGFDSPGDFARRRRPSALSESSDHMFFSPGQKADREMPSFHPTPPQASWRPPHQSIPRGDVRNGEDTSAGDNGVLLAPAPDLAPQRKRRLTASSHHPPSTGQTQHKQYGDLAYSAPAAGAHRPGILRMPSKQAEKDAVDMLLTLSSPKTTGFPTQGSSSARSHSGTSKEELPARRVMFESHVTTEKSPPR